MKLITEIFLHEIRNVLKNSGLEKKINISILYSKPETAYLVLPLFLSATCVTPEVQFSLHTAYAMALVV